MKAAEGSATFSGEMPRQATDLLVERLKGNPDDESWRAFYERYGSFIFSAANQAGLCSADCEDVVQEVTLEVSKKIAEFRYDPGRCQFRTWLRCITRSKIVNVMRRREPAEPLSDEAEAELGQDFEEVWDEEWRGEIAREALRRVKERTNPAAFQAFLLCAQQGRKAGETAKMLRMSTAAVYMHRFKVAREVRREVEKLESGNF